jgi:hypothetical protein
VSQPVVVAVTADQHTGSQLGLCPSEGVRLDEGGEYRPTKAQLWTWEKWLEYHAAIAQLRKSLKAKLIYVSNGDAVDGDHHGTSQIITRNVESQAYIAHRVFSVPKDLKADEYHVVRGTTIHVGEGGASEEALAKHLKAQRDPVSESWSVWHLRLHIYGRELDFQHHCSVGGLPWTVAGGVARLAFRHRVERIEAGLRPADLIIRSHKHTHLDSYDAHKTRAIVTPAWQLKTSHAHKVAPESIADIGGIAVVVEPDGQYAVQKWLYQPTLPQPRQVT